MRKTYSTDLSDAEWLCIEPYLPTPKAPDGPRCTPCARDPLRYLLHRPKWLCLALGAARVSYSRKTIHHSTPELGAKRRRLGAATHCPAQWLPRGRRPQ